MIHLNQRWHQFMKYWITEKVRSYFQEAEADMKYELAIRPFKLRAYFSVQIKLISFHDGTPWEGLRDMRKLWTRENLLRINFGIIGVKIYSYHKIVVCLMFKCSKLYKVQRSRINIFNSRTRHSNEWKYKRGILQKKIKKYILGLFF